MSSYTDTGNNFERNLALLKKHQPQAWELMHKFTPDTLHDVYITEHGNTNLRVIGPDDQLITMHQDPESGIIDDNFLGFVPENSTGFVCILGMGLGYGPLAIAKNRPRVQGIAVFELDPGIFHAALRYTDLADLLSDPRLLLSVSPEPNVIKTLSPGKSALMLESIHTLRHLASFALNEAYESVNDQVFDFANGLNVGGNTSLHYGETFIANRLNNIRSIHHDFLLDKLHNRFADTPAFLVAGGPSLDGNIHHLAKAQGKGIIIAVDSILPTLLEHGITPDFVTAIDPQKLVFEKFAPVTKREEVKDISLICMPWVASKVGKIFPARKTFWAFSAGPMESWLNNAVGGTLLTGGAATVAHLNMQAAVLLGCSPIVFVGQDLAYPNKKDHARGTVLTHKDNMNRLFEGNPDLIWADSTNGEKIPTNRSLFFMKKHFEEMIKSSPGNYINASEGGINIEGTTVLSLQETIAMYCTENKNIQHRIHSQEIETGRPDQERLLQEFNAILPVIRKLKKFITATSKSANVVLREFQKQAKGRKRPQSITDLPKQIQGRIVDINTNHNKLDNEGIWHILNEATLAIKRDTDRLRQEVKRLADKPGKYIQWLTKSLSLLETVSCERMRVLDFFEKHILSVADFLREEKTLNRNPESEENRLKLARLYYQAQELVLLESALNDIGPNSESAAEVHFYRGVIAAHRTDYDLTDSHFKKATNLDTTFTRKIIEFRENLAEEYKGFEQNSIIDASTKRKMLLKGLRYCPHYKPILEVLHRHAGQAIKSIKAELQIPEKTNIGRDNLQTWIKDIEENSNLKNALTFEELAEFYKILTSIQIHDNDIPGLLNSYSLILSYTPDAPEIHLQITDILFKIGEYHQGIRHLTKAIELDSANAVHWESIGDKLFDTGQFNEAIFAYEQCFMAMPENTGLLKKIGDCYIAMDQPEAAKEAYLALKKILTGETAAPPPVH